MNIVIYLLAALLGFLGLVFIIGSQGQVLRIIIGAALFAGAAVLIYLTRVRPSSTTVVQKIDLSGDVSLQDLKCRSCGGHLTDKSITVKAGAILVNCEYCGAAYQMEEEPKW